MNETLLDVYHDLKQKRLLPVAVVLALALVAVPLFLLDGSTPEGRSGPLPRSGALPSVMGTPRLVALEDASELRSSRLDAFRTKDPFKKPGSGRADLPSAGAVADGLRTLADGISPDGGASSSLTASSSLGDSLSAPLLEPNSGGSTGGSGGGATGGSSGGSGGSTPGSPTPTPSGAAPIKPPRTVRKEFAYRIDLRLGLAGEVRTEKDVKRLTPLPSDTNPLILFLGVSEDGEEATFLVDAKRVTPSGEGECRPSPESCSVLTLRDDPDADTHAFTDAEGRRYELRLLDIHLDEVSDSEEAASDDETTAKSEGTTRGETTDGEEGATAGGARVRSAGADADGDGRESLVERRLESWFTGFFDLLRVRR